MERNPGKQTLSLAELRIELGAQGLVVEGPHAVGVTEVVIYDAPDSSRVQPVKPIVVWDGNGEPTTFYFPINPRKR